MFYVLKDENGRYIHRDATFSGGYYIVYTDNIKYARLWDKEDAAFKVSKNWNNYFIKTARVERCRCSFTPSNSWSDYVDTFPTKTQVVEVKLFEVVK